MTHHLQTCKIPLSAVTAYYRRNTGVGPRDVPLPVLRGHTVWIRVGDSADHEGGSAAVEVLIVEFAAHVAYLQPGTGAGFLVMPPPGTDVGAGDFSWPQNWHPDPQINLSLRSAGRTYALQRLAMSGWTLLQDESGGVETAGETVDGRQALCLYAVRASHELLVLKDLHRGLAALHFAADLRHPPTESH